MEEKIIWDEELREQLKGNFQFVIYDKAHPDCVFFVTKTKRKRKSVEKTYLGIVMGPGWEMMGSFDMQSSLIASTPQRFDYSKDWKEASSRL